MITKETKDFCEYLVKGGLFQRVLLENEEYQNGVQQIIQHADELRNENKKSIQLVLSEYDEWLELKKNT